MTSWTDLRRLRHGAGQMKQLQERDLRELSMKAGSLGAQRDALRQQCDAIGGLIESSRLSQVQLDLAGLQRELRAGALLRQQVRELGVRATTLDEANDALVAQREQSDALRQRWWRKETKYTRMTAVLRKTAQRRALQREVIELEERLAWKR
ncbi:hypothetical protein PIN31009_00272 [Pandoraea iniqua]|uniref:hypothetical protein n=1 Tax=Pandoraea iniqua TaxID=2508288 RepID=UPI00125627FF|nr:hypothetical protein [Pandoraea iniqua]VVD64357.1 hypothetical protein PIN31009_00272 [Pandoraea iniqua]